jgi:hypothetical protein
MCVCQLQVLLDHEALKEVLESPYHCKYNPAYCTYVHNASCDVLRTSLHGMTALVASGTRNFSYKANVTQTVDASSSVMNNYLNIPDEVGDAATRQANIPVNITLYNITCNTQVVPHNVVKSDSITVS